MGYHVLRTDSIHTEMLHPSTRCHRANTRTHLRNPEPNSLDDISRDLLGPVSILCIQSCLACCDVGVGGVDPVGSLEDLPESVQQEEDWNADVGCEEAGDAPVGVMLANKDIEAIEDDYHSEVEKRKPRCVWLESTLEDKSVAINSLGFERFVELNVGDADRAPCEEGGNSDQILEPSENYAGPTWANREVCESGDGGCDGDTPVGNAGFAAAEKETWCLFVLGKSEEVTRSSVKESVGGG